MEIELFDEFTHTVVSNHIVKNWSVLYKGKELKGSYTFDHDDWGYHERSYEMDEEYKNNLTDEEYEEVMDYVEENI